LKRNIYGCLSYNVPRSVNYQSKIFRLDFWKDCNNLGLDVLVDLQNTKILLKDETLLLVKFTISILYVRSKYLDGKIKYYDRNKRKLKNINTIK